MTTKREQARKLLAPIFLPEVLPAILDAMEIMGQPVCSHGQDAYCTNCRTAPEPVEPLDTRVCRAMGKHGSVLGFCASPFGGGTRTCYRWSTSELGVGAMLRWLEKEGRKPNLDDIGNGTWDATGWMWDGKQNAWQTYRGDTPQAALANAVAAVGGRDD